MTAVSIYTDIMYRQTPQRDLYLDLRVPSPVLLQDKPAPLVLFIPMGGMRSCVKENAPWWLTEYGFAMASIECRVSSEAVAPAPIHDCKAAVRWLRTHATEYGYDADSIGVWGQSAGGLLASLVATSGDRAEIDYTEADGTSCRVQAACAECGAPHDFLYFADPVIKARFAPVAENLRLYLGGEVEARPELARQVSPSTYVSSDCPPMLLIHGDADTIVPVEETVAFHQLLLKSGVDATLRILPGEGHAWDPGLTRRDILSFFKRTLHPPQ